MALTIKRQNRYGFASLSFIITAGIYRPTAIYIHALLHRFVVGFGAGVTEIVYY